MVRFILLLLLLIVFVLSNSSFNQTQIRCMNFYGLETERAQFVCNWHHEPRYYLDMLLRELSINTIRLPFSYHYAKWSDYNEMDAFIHHCSELNMSVILDYHRTWPDHQGPTPEESITLHEFVDQWINILSRYKDQPIVKGVSVYNEIQTDDFEYTIAMHMAVIEAVEKAFPGKYTFFCGCPKWGGNCARMQPLMNLPPARENRIYIEIHKYVFSGTGDSVDWELSMPRDIPHDKWFVGEFGWKHGEQKEREWAETFLTYLVSRNITNACAWTIAHSGDTEGWWQDDCETFNYEKAALLKSLWTRMFKRLRRFISYTHS